MPIADLQRSLTELGRIRLGKKKENGKPARLDTFRFTSPAQHLIEEIAALYGGEVAEWNGSNRGRQWETITAATIIPVFLPRQKIDPWYEQWGKEVCMRRCDGIRDTIHDQPCDCVFSQAGKPNKCKPTTRVNVMLADVVGLGQWRVETHGIYAASELMTISELIAGAQIPLPGRLLLENRTSKQWDRDENRVVVKDFNVPVVLLDAVTARQVQIGGDALTQAVRMSQGAAAVEAGPQAPALEAAPAGPTQADIASGIAAIADATTLERMRAIAEVIKQMGSPEELTTAYKARWAVLREDQLARGRAAAATEAPEASAEAAPPTEAPAPPAEPVAATPEPPAAAPDDPAARKAALQTLLGEAGARKINTPTLEGYLRDGFDGATIQTATTAQFEQLTEMLRRQK